MKSSILGGLVVFLVVLALTVPIPARAIDLKAGVSGRGQWYNLCGGQTHLGPNSSLTVLEVKEGTAKVIYTWTIALNWGIKVPGSQEYMASVITGGEGAVKEIAFKAPSGKIFIFFFDPNQKGIKGKCTTPEGYTAKIDLE